MARNPFSRTRNTSNQSKPTVPEKENASPLMPSMSDVYDVSSATGKASAPFLDMGNTDPFKVDPSPELEIKDANVDFFISKESFQELYNDLDLAWRMSRNPQVNSRVEVALTKMKKYLNIP